MDSLPAAVEEVTLHKLETPVAYPLRDLSLARHDGSTETYDLRATVNHFGQISSGHYTAFALRGDALDNSASESWFHFDDSTVERVLDFQNAHASNTRNAYCLLYQRRQLQSSVIPSATVQVSI